MARTDRPLPTILALRIDRTHRIAQLELEHAHLPMARTGRHASGAFVGEHSERRSPTTLAMVTGWRAPSAAAGKARVTARAATTTR
jgi:hypothetical protein